jgi:hypothetical protein
LVRREGDAFSTKFDRGIAFSIGGINNDLFARDSFYQGQSIQRDEVVLDGAAKRKNEFCGLS